MGTVQKPSRDPVEFGPMAAETSGLSAPEPEVPSQKDKVYEELRELILAPEQHALEQLRHRVDDPESRTEDVGRVVAEAIHLRRQRGGDEALSAALSPTIETALRESVRKDPGTLADALFPVMGPAIRRSILETLRSFLESFNQVLDQSLSIRGLKWRIEALRTGRSFTEVALLHSLVFRVEQAFVIHKKTGLPLGHAVAPAVAIQDPNLVSGMLSAIQDFVRDSFHGEQGQIINRMNVGDLDVWIEGGPYAILACVIRGVAPRNLRDRMAEVLENLHQEYAKQLVAFEGDSAPFAKMKPALELCLEQRHHEEANPRSFGFVYTAAALLILLIAGWIGWRAVQYSRWERLVNDLRDQPGYLITSFGREHGKFVVRGMRDPLSVDPGQIVRNSSVNPSAGDFHWGAYYALDDRIVQKRAIGLLSPPAAAKLVVRDGALDISGTAPVSWVLDVEKKALLIPGIRAVLFAPELQPDRLAFSSAKTEIENTVIKFPLASAILSPSERAEVHKLAEKMKTLLNAAQALHEDALFLVVGHTDTSGAETWNLNLSQKRADFVAGELTASGISDKLLRAQGVGTTQPVRPEDSEANRRFNRGASFRVMSPLH